MATNLQSHKTMITRQVLHSSQEVLASLQTALAEVVTSSASRGAGSELKVRTLAVLPVFNHDFVVTHSAARRQNDATFQKPSCLLFVLASGSVLALSPVGLGRTYQKLTYLFAPTKAPGAATGMVKAYLRYELSNTFAVINSNANLVYDHTGKLVVSAALENVNVWNARQGTLVRAAS